MEYRKSSISDMPFSEVENDFGTKRYVDGLITFIEHSSTPITIALQGEWGSGKTSLMTRLKRELCDKPKSNFVGVEINTWEHSMMSTPDETVYKIMAHLVQELAHDDPQPSKTLKKIARGVGNILWRGGREGLKTIPGVGPLIAIGMEAANISTQLPYAQDDDSQIVSLSTLRKELEHAIDATLAKTKRQGIIVFVDDLDRLNPPVAVEILELLKNVFTLNNCIFVLAIDYDVVVKGLKPKFGELTPKNAREFRSFFDKIIQVPFSLPVNSYRPMDFVINSLVSINYLQGFESANPKVRDQFTEVIECSVGKNPRSIKRLINTLSLIDCIAQCGQEKRKPTIDDKLLNFIVVALQVCYPVVYDMLAKEPCFKAWNAEFAAKMGIILDNKEKDNAHAPQWEDILEAACQPDTYLAKHYNDIVHLLNMVLTAIPQQSNDLLAKKMQEIIDKSSVTGIKAEVSTEDLQSVKKDLIYALHANVKARVEELRPDMIEMRLKRNTGNGGMYVWYEDDDDCCFDIVFNPDINPKGQICLRIWLTLCVGRPKRLQGSSFDEIIQDPTIDKAVSDFDDVLVPLLSSKTWFFKGRTYEGHDTYFPSYRDELKFLYDEAWMEDYNITNNPTYYIDLDKPSYFEQPEVVDAIARVVIANHDFWKTIQYLK